MPQAVDRVLAGSRLFEGLEPESIEQVVAAGNTRRLSAGEALFRQGDAVDALQVVEKGRIKLAQVTVEGDEVVVCTIGPGEIVAGVALLDKRVFPVSGIAVVETRVRLWSRPRIQELAARFPALRTNVLSTIADRMQDSLSRIRELATEKASQRVARALLRLARENGREVESGVLIDRPLGRQEVAELAGASMYTASRLLARWAREGVLEVGRQRVVVRSFDRLEALAEHEDPHA